MTKQDVLDRLHLDLPVVAAPMFIVSQPALVRACCGAGIVGTFPALNQRSSEGFERWLVELKAHRSAVEGERGRPLPAYGVNLIVHRTNPRVQADLEICVRQQVPLIITSLGAVKEVVDAVHSYGGLVFHDVTNARHARKAIEAGVDGLILVCAGAGGHAGTANPMALIHEIRSFWQGVILLGGAISTGRDVASALQMGADLAYMGTRFINTEEAVADDAYKQMIIDARVQDIVYTAAVSGVPANFLAPSLLAAGIPKEMWGQSRKIDFGEELDSEAKAWKTLWSAGQGVAAIHDTLPAADLVARLRTELLQALDEQAARRDHWGQSDRC